jgi:hypothetical protein
MSPPRRNLAAEQGIFQQQEFPEISDFSHALKRQGTFQNRVDGNF